MAKTAEEVQGLEYDWLGIDEDGYLGFFSTAGGGRAPAAFLARNEEHQEAIDALLASNPSTGADFHPVVADGLPNDWKAMAERGVFGFDSDPNGGPYTMVAKPVQPLLAADSVSSAVTAESVVKVSVRFADFARGEPLPDSSFE